MPYTKKSKLGEMQKFASGGSNKYDSGSGKAPKGTGMGTGSKRVNPSGGNQQKSAGGRDPGQASGSLAPKIGAGHSRQGASTLYDIKGGGKY